MSIAKRNVEAVGKLPDDFDHEPTLRHHWREIEAALAEHEAVIAGIEDDENRADFANSFAEDERDAREALARVGKLLMRLDDGA